MKSGKLLQRLMLAALLILPAQLVAADLQLARLFQDGLVLQRDTNVPV